MQSNRKENAAPFSILDSDSAIPLGIETDLPLFIFKEHVSVKDEGSEC